jgi:hypothetical protein
VVNDAINLGPASKSERSELFNLGVGRVGMKTQLLKRDCRPTLACSFPLFLRTSSAHYYYVRPQSHSIMLLASQPRIMGLQSQTRFIYYNNIIIHINSLDHRHIRSPKIFHL